MVTKTLAANIVDYQVDALAVETIHEAKKCFLNWLANAVGAHRHPSMSMMLNVAKEMESAPQATVLGTGIRTDLQFASLLNGMSSSMFDFDDTFLDTILHPSAPVFPALVAWGEHKPLSGRLLLQAFVIGVEIEERVALFLGRKGHYEKGWHVTGTAGTFGATAAMAKILGLSKEQMVWALGIASTQAAGVRTMFGTYAKPIHAGKAASNGMLSALLAKQGMTGPPDPLEAPKGYGALASDSYDISQLSAPWGRDWLIMKNTYKPFACGIVAHPAIDAAVRLRCRGISAADIRSLSLEVHPLALELTGKPEPKDTLEAIFSVYHGVAVGILDGKAGQWQYTTERVCAADVAGMRRKVKATATSRMGVDQALLKAELNNGDTVTIFVDAVHGSLQNPLSDKDLEYKFKDMTSPYLSQSKQDRICGLVWRLDQQPSVQEIVDLCKSDK
jgi:2-methylcitrate dehydratase PrpD